MGGNPHRFLRIARKKEFRAKIAVASGFNIILLLSAQVKKLSHDRPGFFDEIDSPGLDFNV